MIPPIERDEPYQRDYIPVGAGWEIQTKGKGSTFRLSDDNGDRRLAIPDSPYLHETLTQMAQEVHAAWQQENTRSEDLARALTAVLRTFAEPRKCFISQCKACQRHEDVRILAHTALENHYVARNLPYDPCPPVALRPANSLG